MTRTIGIACVLMLTSSIVQAESAEEAYQAIFGQDEKKATVSNKSAAEFAGKLVAAVDKDIIESRELKILVCRKAFEFGMKDKAGLSSALDAANRLVKLDPDRADEVGEMRLKVRERQYQFTSGPEKRGEAVSLAMEITEQARRKLQDAQPSEAVKLCQKAGQIVGRSSPYAQPCLALQRTCTAQENAEKEAAMLEGTDKSALTQATAKKLLWLYLLELDSPLRASKVLDAVDADQATRTNVALAAKELKKLTKEDCLRLGAWYREIKASKGLAQAHALRRALTYYREFRKQHDNKDSRDTTARIAIEEIVADLAEAEGAADGTLFGNCDDEFSLAINGKMMMSGEKWSEVTDCPVRLREGDVIAVRVRDTGGARGFVMLMLSPSRKPITGTRQRDWVEYEPLSETSWWVPASDRFKSCSVPSKNGCLGYLAEKTGIKKPSCQAIWGTRKIAFVMHVVTAEELGQQK